MPTNPLLRPLAPLLALLLVLAACGGGDDGDAADTTDPVAEDGAGTEPADADAAPSGGAGPAGGSSSLAEVAQGVVTSGSGRFEGSFSAADVDPSDGIDPTLTVLMTGSYDTDAEASQLSMDLSGLADLAAEEAGDTGGLGFDGMFDEPMQVITIGDESWMQWSLFDLFTGTPGAWLAASPDELAESGGDLGVSGAPDPIDLLTDLSETDIELTEVGTETIRGVETNHWRAVVDADELQADNDDDLASSEAEAAAIEVWIDQAGLLHRYRLLVLVDEAAADGDLDAVDPDAVEAEILFDFLDHNQPVDIQPPPADLIVAGDGLLGGF